MQPFLETLESRVLVCDGAMGTMLYARGVFLNRSFDELNLTEPNLVLDVHRAYAQAGAEVLETNTFGANRPRLAAFGLADRLRAINVEGARLARRAAGEAYVAGAIGPLGVRLTPWGKTSPEEAEARFGEQAEALVEGGVDLFILETFRDMAELAAAVRAVRAACGLPIVAQMTTGDDGNAPDGTPPDVFAPELVRQGADVIGVNCSVGPATMLETIERLARATDRPLSAQPNAGRPRDVEGRNLYLSSPEYMASYARRFVSAGVRLVGGCCGTTPAHIRQMRAAVDRVGERLAPRVVSAAPGPVSSDARRDRARGEPATSASGSRLSEALAQRRFVFMAQLRPPRGGAGERIVEQARMLREEGIEFVSISDEQRAAARLSAQAAAVLVEQRGGVEAILQFACRGRHLLEMQSELLGAHALGLRNLLVLTGDPVTARERAAGGAPADEDDVDSIGLTRAIATRFNRGLDLGEQSIGEPTSWQLGVVANPTALDLERELDRLRAKLDAGATFVVTRPVFDLHAFETFHRAVGARGVPIIATVWVFDSVRRAELLANEVPGITVPPALVERLARSRSEAHARAEAVAVAREIAAALRESVQGLQIATALDDPALTLEAIKALEPFSLGSSGPDTVRATNPQQ